MGDELGVEDGDGGPKEEGLTSAWIDCEDVEVEAEMEGESGGGLVWLLLLLMLKLLVYGDCGTDGKCGDVAGGVGRFMLLL